MASDGLFQLRTCRSEPGKLGSVIARIGGIGREILTKHGAEVTGLWSAPDSDDPTTGTVVYICKFASRADADAVWDAFHTDERWIEGRIASEADGPIIASSESLYMRPTDFSPSP
jgi:hypothetical protein